MSDTLISVLGMIVSIVTALSVAVPKAVMYWARKGETDAKAETERQQTERAGMDIADRVMKSREREHADCRQEVAALRLEVGAAKEAVDDCQAKHSLAEERIDLQDVQIVELRDLISWLKFQIERIDRKSDPHPVPPFIGGEPAE